MNNKHLFDMWSDLDGKEYSRRYVLKDERIDIGNNGEIEHKGQLGQEPDE